MGRAHEVNRALDTALQHHSFEMPALKKGIRSIKTKFMLGNKRRKAEDEIEEEFLRETVIDRERTKDKYVVFERENITRITT